MKKLFSILSKIFRFFWKSLLLTTTALSALSLVLMFVIMYRVYIGPPVTVPDGAALVLTPRGNIVEQATIDPLMAMIGKLTGDEAGSEVVLQDLLDVIDHAAMDDRIELIVLDLSRLTYGGLDQLRDIGHHLTEFKKSGKSIVAAGGYFNQMQYYLAAHADELYLHPMGGVFLQGFGVYRMYIKDMLDKLDINFHIFKVGTFKSALEPLQRNEMSEAAKAANQLWLGKLWDNYRATLVELRDLDSGAINDYVNRIDIHLKEAAGDAAQVAFDLGLVDDLKSMQAVDQYLIEKLGTGESAVEYRQISGGEYLSTLSRSYRKSRAEKVAESSDHGYVAVIVAQGEIIHGDPGTGFISSLELSERIRQARGDAKVRGLVLRIDTPGGSAFGSEVIRQALLDFQAADKPVVISMGSVAASGGYWVAADANYIFASPLTLTGSIGIFGVFPTFEKTLARYGVNSDGIGTTKLAGAGNPLRPMSTTMAQAIQLGVEDGYERFLTIVGEGRQLPRSRVLELAEGRVWDGETALALGLVDKLGSLEEAVVMATELSGVERDAAYYLKPKLPPELEILYTLRDGARALLSYQQRDRLLESISRTGLPAHPVLGYLERRLAFLRFQSDPANQYAHALLPPYPVSL